MPSTKTTARLETRMDADIYAQIQRAAELTDSTLTAFVNEVLRKASMQVIEQHEMLALTRADQERFAQVLLSPQNTTPALERAFEHRRRLLNIE